MTTTSLEYDYTKKHFHYTLLEDGLQILIKRVDNNISKIVFFDTIQNKQVPIPDNIVMTDSSGSPVGRFGDEFAITWIEPFYELYRRDDKILSITRQQKMIIENHQDLDCGNYMSF
jgi:uncharacterized protein YxjI